MKFDKSCLETRIEKKKPYLFVITIFRSVGKQSSGVFRGTCS